MNKIDIYLNTIHETQIISEDVGIDMSGINKGLVKKINNFINVKDPYESMKKIKKITPPGFNINAIQKVENYMSKKYKKFSIFKSTASSVIKNSLPGVSPKMIDIASGFLSISSIVTKKGDKNKDPKTLLKMNIKEFVTKCRKFGEEHDDEDNTSKTKLRPGDIADLSVAWVVITMATAMAAGLVTGSYIISSAVAVFITGGALSTIFTVGVILTFILGIILIIRVI